jgi:BarA-like signal transduction histidine kinase
MCLQGTKPEFSAKSVCALPDEHYQMLLSHLKINFRAGEMAQWLEVLTALLKVLSSNPSNHMVSHNHP